MNDDRQTVVEQIMRLQGLMHRYQMQSFMEFGPWANPERGQGRVLSILNLKPEISQKELTYLLDMSKQALAELLAKLEKSEYIVREPSEEDRRSLNIKLTEAGAAVAAQIDEGSPELESVLDVLSDEELANLHDYLQRIIARLEEQVSGDDDDFRERMARRHMRRWGRGPGVPGGPHGRGGPERRHGRGGPDDPGGPDMRHGRGGPDRPHGRGGPHGPGEFPDEQAPHHWERMRGRGRREWAWA